MRLVSKSPPKYFWVEDFNDKDRIFFEKLGFKYVEARGPVSFGFKPTLEFQGKLPFGLWSDEKCDEIYMSVVNEYGKFEVEQYIPD